MKKFLVFVIFVVMLFTGCASHLAAGETHMDALPEWDLEPIDHQPYIQNTYVTMTVSKVSHTGCTVHMVNNREMIIHMGSEFSYSLQMWDGEHWCKLVPKKDLGAIGGEAVSMAERITKVRWRSDYGRLPDGLYRILVPYSAQSYKAGASQNWQTCYAVCEFEIS